MDLDKKTKNVGRWNCFYEAKPTMGEKAKHESYHDFYAPIEEYGQEQRCVLTALKEKKKRIAKIAILAVVAAAIIGVVIWQVIENPQYFSFVGQ